ncbi:MAG: hypothetical protein LBU98_04140 [Alistipes sp.]|jgi:hypothetical protein|nr:hypothetical protein [Alistipes sp.]
MKRSALIIAALAAFALGGCNMVGGPNSSTATFSVRVETTEVVETNDGVDVYITKLKYNEMGLVSEEVTTKNGRPWKTTKDYGSDNDSDGNPILFCTRVTTNDDGTTVTHKLVSTFGAYHGNNPLETKFEMLTTDAAPRAVERRTVEYNGNQLKKYESWTVDGGTVSRTDFRYSNSSKPTQTFTETRDGEAPVRVGITTTQYDSDLNPLEYKMYRNITEESDWDGESGQLIEERADYTTELNKNSWTNIKYAYDAEGVRTTASTTEVENEYQNITVTYY